MRPIRMKEMKESQQPLSEQFRVVAKQWVDLDGAARLLEETKSAVFGQKVMAVENETSIAAKETRVRGSPDWEDHVKKIVQARTDANLKKVQLEYIRMKHSEWLSLDANSRTERKMGVRENSP